MSRDFPVTGLKELDAVLSVLPKKMQKQAYRRALTAAARPIRDEARMRAPKKSGKMAKSIKTGSPRQNQDGTFSVQIRPDGEHGFLALFHEYGTRPHVIGGGDSQLAVRTLNRRMARGGFEQRANGLLKIFGHEYERRVHTKAGEEIRTLTIDKHYVSGAVMHPGTAAQPFMRPALDNKGKESLEEFAKVIREFLEYNTGFKLPSGRSK